MRRLLSNRDVTKAAFDTAPFEGDWLAAFGRPELKGTWTIFGSSGSGKTTFALMLCKYLSQFGRVMYDSLEQGLSRSMQLAWERVGMREAGRGVVFADRVQLEELRERLSKPKSAQMVIIDSVTAMQGFRKGDYADLVRDFPRKLFVFIAHEKNHKAFPAVAEYVRCLSDVKICVEGYAARVVSRYATGPGYDFVIWEDGYRSYHIKELE